MSAPKRVKVSVETLESSAFILQTSEVLLQGKPVCKKCAPARTQMTYLAKLMLRQRDGHEIFDLYRCTHCGTDWAVNYFQHYEEGK